MKNKLKDKDWLHNQYVTNKKSTQKIASEVGCVKSNVSYALKKFNIPMRTTRDYIINNNSMLLLDDKDWLYEQYIINKKNLTDISSILSISANTVRLALKKHNIETRNLSQAFNIDIYSLISNKDWLYEQYVILDKSITKISSELNTSNSTIYNYIKNHNIEIKPTSEKKLGKSYNMLNDKDWLFNQYITLSKSSQNIANELTCDKKTICNHLRRHDIEIRTEHSVSSLEHKIRNFLDDNNISYISSDREQIKPLELDIFIPDKMIAIEINGVYWHSELYKSSDYHESKRKLCNEKNIRLIQLYEDDLNERFDIIKRFLLNALNINNEERIFARKCSINHKPNKDMVKRFMDLYHIQGYAANNKAISLDYAGKIVAVMLFKGNVLTRYTTSKKVVGGFSKLLKSSSVDEIITFVDLDTFTGDAYFKVGFEIDSYLKPDYKYVVGNKRIHKFNFRLKKFREDPNLLYEEGLTEKQLAQLNNIPRIYDSGKYRLKINLGK